MTEDSLSLEKRHLAGLLEAVQRCSYFLNGLDDSLPFPLSGEALRSRCKDRGLFDSLAALNERYSKLQDTCASVMRHAAMLSAERTETFLAVLSFYEKVGVIDSVEGWQRIRMIRNMASHDYETSYAKISEHFNAIHSSIPQLLRTGVRLVEFCAQSLAVVPNAGEFSGDYLKISERYR
jgi:hypothetical protein